MFNFEGGGGDCCCASNKLRIGIIIPAELNFDEVKNL